MDFCLPLYGSQRTPDRLTLGPRVGEVALRLGKPYLPHQQHIVDIAMEIDNDTGLFAYSKVILIGPRQVTGKTELILPVMTHRCAAEFDDGPQRVLYTAQDTDESRQKWRDVHVERIKTSRYKEWCSFRLQRTMEAIIWFNGSMWMPGSTTPKKGGTGDTLDLGVIDEAWSRKDSRLELGMRPAMMTRDWSQLWILSMIPGLSRAAPGEWPYLKNYRTLGRERVKAGINKGIAFFDYVAPEGWDPRDPATWYMCMPALMRNGVGTVRLERIAEDCQDMDIVDFEAEYLSWEPKAVSPHWTLIGRNIWSERFDSQSTIDRDLVLAVEMNEDRDQAWIGAAGKRPGEENFHIEIIEPGHKIAIGVDGVDWLETRLFEIIDDQKPKAVVVDPSRPAASLIVPLKRAGKNVLTPDGNSVANACGRFYDYTGQTASEGNKDSGIRLFHIGQSVIDTAISQATKLDLGKGKFTLVKKGTASTIAPLYCVILALHGSEVIGGDLEPDIFI